MIALEEAVRIIEAQESWNVNDDLCDCVYQRIGSWFNPYIGERYEVRLCCVWAEMEKQWPQFFRRVQIEPAEWNGEADMPRSIWHRQIARAGGMSVADARELVRDRESPRGVPLKEKPVLWLPWSGEYLPIELG